MEDDLLAYGNLVVSLSEIFRVKKQPEKGAVEALIKYILNF